MAPSAKSKPSSDTTLRLAWATRGQGGSYTPGISMVSSMAADRLLLAIVLTVSCGPGAPARPVGDGGPGVDGPDALAEIVDENRDAREESAADGGSPSPPDAAVDGATEDRADDATDVGDAPAGTCVGQPPGCTTSTAGGTCSDAFQMSVCIAGQWQCPGNTFPASECRCIGAPPPRCVCGPTGFVCSDGGFG